MAIYEVLDGIMKEKGISIADIARICSLPDSTVRGIIRRKQETIALEVAFKLSDGLGVSLEKLNGMPEKIPFEKENPPLYSTGVMKLAADYESLDNHGKRIVQLVASEEKVRCTKEKAAALHKERKEMEAGEESVPDNIYQLPIYSLPMSAGTGQEAGQEYPEDFLLIKRPPRGTSYIARVSGISMEPTYHDGDLIFVCAYRKAEIGEVGVFLMDGQHWIKERGEDALISHNPDYAPIPMRDDIECQGLVLGVCDESYFE